MRTNRLHHKKFPVGLQACLNGPPTGRVAQRIKDDGVIPRKAEMAIRLGKTQVHSQSPRLKRAHEVDSRATTC